MRLWFSFLGLLFCCQLYAFEGLKIVMNLDTPKESMELTQDFAAFAENAKIITTGVRWQKENDIWILQSSKPFSEVQFILNTSVKVASSYSLIDFMNSGDALLYWPYWNSLFSNANFHISIEASEKQLFVDGEPLKDNLIKIDCRCFVLIANDHKVQQLDDFSVYFHEKLSQSQRNLLIETLGSQLEFYTLKFGKLSRSPLFVFDLSDVNNGVSSGDVESNVTYFQFDTSLFDTSSNQILSFNKLLFHETFHLWHSVLFTEAADKWIYEGTANAVTLKALVASKFLSKQGFEEEVAESVNQCSSFIEGKSLEVLTFDDAIYQCGNLFFSALFMSDEALFSLDTLWTQPLDKIQLLQKITKNIDDKSFGAVLERMIQGDFDTSEFPDLFPNTVLVNAGDANATMQELKVACASLFAKIMANDCHGVSFSLSDKGLQVQQAPNCSNIVDGVIDKINGLSFPKQCISIHDNVVSHCQYATTTLFSKKETVSLGYIDNTQVLATCPAGLLHRAVRYQFR